MSAATLAALRRFASSDVDVARCDLCAGAIGPDHEHLLDPTTRQLQCACLVCGRILGTSATARWKLVRRRVERLPACDIPDETWAELRLPIDLAFFVRTGNDVVARYPSPAGLVESSVPASRWSALVAGHPALADLDPEVEALLVNRTGGRRQYFRASIDECYHLVGLIRAHWRGFTGGPDVREHVERFFARLERSAGAAHV